MKKLNTAIVGFGLSGSTFHAPLITNTNCFNLKYINSSQVEKVQKLYPNVSVVTDFDQLCRIKELDLIIIRLILLEILIRILILLMKLILLRRLIK